MIMLGSQKDDEHASGFMSPLDLGGVETRSVYIVVPDADRALFRRWSDAVIESTDATDEERAAELGEMATFLLDRIDAPAGRSTVLLDVLKGATLEDRPLNRAEIMGFCLTLLVAGNETTRTLLSGGVEALADPHPGLRPDRVGGCGAVRRAGGGR